VIRERRRPSVSTIIAVLAAAAWGATCAGCAPANFAPIPQQAFGALPLEPEGWYRIMHAEMESCLKLRRDFDKIRWFIVRPGVMDWWGESPTGKGEIAGRWSWPNKIFLDGRYVLHEGVVRHEIAHYLLGLGVNDQHNDPRFRACVDYPGT
jgi:hypothetical protein